MMASSDEKDLESQELKESQDVLPNDFDVVKSAENAVSESNSVFKSSIARIIIGICSLIASFGLIGLSIYVLKESSNNGNGGLVILGFFILLSAFFPIGIIIYQCTASPSN